MSKQEIVLIRKELSRVWGINQELEEQIKYKDAESENLRTALAKEQMHSADLKTRIIVAEEKLVQLNQKIVKLKQIIAENSRGDDNKLVEYLYDEIEELENEVAAAKTLLDFYNSRHMPSRTISTTARRASNETTVPVEEQGTPGQKKGHVGSSKLKPPSTDTIRYEDDRCIDCNTTDITHLGTILHRITDTPPPPPPETKSHIGNKYCCNVCGKIWDTSSRIPYKIPGTEFGPRILAKTGSLFVNGMSQGMIREIFEELFNINVSKATINNAIIALVKFLKPIVKAIWKSAEGTKYVGLDETVYKIKTKRGYIWVAVTDKHVLVYFAPTRGAIVLDQHFKPFKDKPKIVDGYPAYPKDEKTQRCWAHTRNDSKSAIDTTEYKTTTEMLHDELMKIHHIAKGRPPGSNTSDLSAIVRNIVEQHEKLGNKKFATKLSNAEPYLFTFVQHEGMQSTNNDVEQRIRKLVIKRNISSHVVSNTGMEAIGVLFTFGLTCSKQGKSVHDEILTILQGKETTLITGE